MGLFKKQKREQRKREQIIEERVTEFRKKVAELGRSYGMAIVPIITKYGLEVEIRILADRDPNKPLPYETSTPESEETPNPLTLTEEQVKSIEATQEIEEGHSKDFSRKI